jgi:hypothetical protein
MTRVPGLRLVTQCVMDGRMPDPAQGCWRELAFWASNDQFTPSLGVDLAAMQRPDPGNDADALELVQVLDRGSDAGFPPMQIVQASVVARTADGRVLYSNPRMQRDTTVLTGILDYAEPFRPGRKVRVLTWARRFDRSAPAARAVIVDIELMR